MIRRLRVLVPVIFGLALSSEIAVILLEGFGAGLGFHCAGLLSLDVFISITVAGTMPINEAVLSWEPGTPPEGWRTIVLRWERLDTARTWVAVAAFGLFLAAVLLH